MRDFTALRIGALAPSGIRKVNEKALAMERAGERVGASPEDRAVDVARSLLERAVGALDALRDDHGEVEDHRPVFRRAKHRVVDEVAGDGDAVDG